MPEYTIKLDVDSTELGRKLSATVKQAFTQAIGGSQGSMGIIMGSGSMKSPILRELVKSNKDLLDLTKVKILKQLEKMDERQKQGFLGKYGPGLVKIAGFSIGMAGLMQFRKMLIDSSPMLQAMMRIMNTSFNLILRPFGDFLGFFLMPFVMGMLQFAIPWYKEFSTKYGAFYTAGQKFFEGNVTESWDLIANAFTESLANILGVKQPGNNPITGAPPPLLAPLMDYLGQQINNWFQENFFNKESTQTNNLLPTAMACPTKQLNLTDSIGILDVVETEVKTAQEKEREIAIIEQLKLDQTNLALEHVEGAVCAFENIDEIIQMVKDGPITQMQRETLDMLRYIRNMKITGRNMSDTMVGTAQAFRAAQSTIYALLNRLAGQTKLSSSNPSVAAQAAQGALGLQPTPISGDYNNARATLTGAYFYNKKFGAGAYQKTAPHLFGGSGSSVGADVLNEWRNFSNAQIQGLRDQGVIKFARGGILREPVFGVGASGQTYQFGEKGPETITPEGTGGGTTVLTFNVYGMGDVHEFESKVKPMVMRWLKESKSNRGIL